MRTPVASAGFVLLEIVIKEDMPISLGGVLRGSLLISDPGKNVEIHSYGAKHQRIRWVGGKRFKYEA